MATTVERAEVPDTIEGLRRQNGALRTLNHHLEVEIAQLRAKRREYYQAITLLDSERAANALLTEEIERLTSGKPFSTSPPAREWMEGLE